MYSVNVKLWRSCSLHKLSCTSRELNQVNLVSFSGEIIVKAVQ